MTDSYLQEKQQRKAYEDQKGEIVFGLLGGFILLVFGIMNNWPIYGSFNLFAIISYVFITIGLCFILLGIIAPSLLRLPYKGFVFIGKKIGNSLLLVFLTVIYIIMVVPVGLIMCKKHKDLGFIAWSGEFSYEEKAFEEIGTDVKKDVAGSIKSPFLKNIYKLFGTLVRNKRAFLIPAAVVLVIVGLILFFAASNIIFNFFIYTLF